MALRHSGEVAYHAIDVLEKQGTDEAAATIRRCVRDVGKNVNNYRDGDEDLALYAIDALKRMMPEVEYADQQIALLAGFPVGSKVGCYAMDVLGEIGDDRAVEYITNVCLRTRNNKEVLFRAVNTLDSMHSDKAVLSLGVIGGQCPDENIREHIRLKLVRRIFSHDRLNTTLRALSHIEDPATMLGRLAAAYEQARDECAKELASETISKVIGKGKSFIEKVRKLNDDDRKELSEVFKRTEQSFGFEGLSRIFDIAKEAADTNPAAEIDDLRSKAFALNS